MQGQRIQQLLATLSHVQVAPLPVFPEQRRVGLLQSARGFLQGGLKAAVDGHDLAGGFHLGGDVAVAVGELVEGPAGYLHHAVVQGRLEGRAGAAGYGVGDLIQTPTDRDLGRYPGDGVPGGLAGQTRKNG